MFKTQNEVTHYFATLNQLIKDDVVLNGIKTNIAIAPSYLAIPTAINLVNSSITLIAQNVSAAIDGAYTSQISYLMLKDVNINKVLIGHSEVRQQLHETDELINTKVKLLLANQISPIVCVGESLQQFEAKQTIDVITKQLKTDLKGLKDNINNLIIAYEPIWAIGTGKTATNDIVSNVCLTIKKILLDIFPQTADQIKVLYGGSVNEHNAQAILKLNGVDGVLVGGASLDPNKFYKIITSTPEYLLAKG
jgi:triosephosphate isomerase